LPGERQFRDVDEQIRKQALKNGLPEDQVRAQFEARRQAALSVNNRHKVKDALAGKIPIGSHDDTTVEHVVEAHEAGSLLAEMPCSIEAAPKAKELGMMVCMGAPNYYRGGSHCGNLSCLDAMAEDLVDILCSDFHFPAMLGSAAKMIESGMDPSDALRLMTINPALHLKRDREIGSIEAGKKADLVAFFARSDHAVVTNVWVDGAMKIRTGFVSETMRECAAV